MCSLVESYARRRRDETKYPISIADSRFWLRLGFVSLYQLVRRLLKPETTLSSAMYRRISVSIDEIVGATAAEIISSAHAHGKLLKKYFHFV